MKTFEKQIRKMFFQRSGQRGAAAVEMALVLPFLLVLVLGVFEFGRAISINNAIINLSREGANLASRTDSPPADIMNALALTAGQLNMQQKGMIYITRILGTTFGKSGKEAQVLEQFRWTGSELDSFPDSKIWTCEKNGASNWEAGSALSSLRYLIASAR